MRTARVKDYWNTVYKRDYKNCILEVNLNGLNNLSKIDFIKGITIICGLNGAGKSTIISAIKDLIGIKLTEHDLRKLNNHKVIGSAIINNIKVDCSNQQSDRLIDKGLDINNVYYIDCEASLDTQSKIIKQSNLEELLEQYEEYVLNDSELEDISFLVGKNYKSCSIRELAIDESDDVYPYFVVNVDGAIYDTTSMGVGEHFLLFSFWVINSIGKDATLIIEEPETYISILSQQNYANYLGRQMGNKGISVILTTHSPYILGNISNENIRIVSRLGNNVSIITPDDSMPADSILGISHKSKGTFFVEDRVAADLLTVILADKAPYLLRQYTIDIAGSESAISDRLKFHKSDKIKYNFIGVYDGDMRNRISQIAEKLNWDYCFLPGNQAIENMFRDYLRIPNNIEKICEFLRIDKNRFIAILATIEGLECHEWFERLRTQLSLEGRFLVYAFYSSFMIGDEEIDRFIEELVSKANY